MSVIPKLEDNQNHWKVYTGNCILIPYFQMYAIKSKYRVSIYKAPLAIGLWVGKVICN